MEASNGLIIKDMATRDNESLCLKLEVPSPIPDFLYTVRWGYGDNLPRRQPDRLRQGKLQHVRETLINIANEAAENKKPPPIYEDILALLDGFVKDVESIYPPVDPKEKLDISLAVFDDQGSVLRFVAANFVNIDKLFNETFVTGEGCAGFSFEKGRVLFYDRLRDDLGYYLSPEEVEKERGTTNLLQYEVVLTVPWIDSPGIDVGVISIGSRFKASRLLRVFGIDDAQQEVEKDMLVNLTKALGELIIQRVFRS